VRARGSATARGYDAAWRTLRDGYLLLHPSCEACLGVGVTKPAKVVDHITPHRGNDSLRLDPTNLQSLCWSHHTRKTRTEGAGYRAPRPA
jgi:5-methylcytosine-specific restriction protein A